MTDLRNQFECVKIRITKTPNLDIFTHWNKLIYSVTFSNHLATCNWLYIWTFVNNLLPISLPLRKKGPNTECFLVRIQENTDQKKLRILTLFTQCTTYHYYVLHHTFSFSHEASRLLPRGVFRTLSNIYDEDFLRKQLTAFNRQLFLQKSCIINIWQDSKYASSVSNSIDVNL